MFNKLKQLGLGQQPTEDEVDPMLDDMYPGSFDTSELDSDPEAVLNDPSADVELKKMAMQKVLDKYLKPKEDNE